MTHVTNHGEAGGPCPQTASLLLPRHVSPEWTGEPSKVLKILYSIPCKKIGQVRFIVIYFYELDVWWFLPTSKSFWGFTTLVNLGWSFQVGISPRVVCRPRLEAWLLICYPQAVKLGNDKSGINGGLVTARKSSMFAGIVQKGIRKHTVYHPKPKPRNL